MTIVISLINHNAQRASKEETNAPWDILTIGYDELFLAGSNWNRTFLVMVGGAGFEFSPASEQALCGSYQRKRRKMEQILELLPMQPVLEFAAGFGIWHVCSTETTTELISGTDAVTTLHKSGWMMLRFSEEELLLSSYWEG